MKKSWKILCFVLVLPILTALYAGCGSSQPAVKKYPSNPINVIIAFGAGGQTDVGARLLLPLVEKELGVAMPVINKAGAGGWLGWADLFNANADGYTVGYINTPNLQTGYLNPSAKRNKSLDDFTVIANHVLDYGAIGIRKDDKRFKNIKEMIEYAKTHELTASTTGIASDDHIAILKLNKMYGTKIVAVHMKTSSDGKVGLLGGHIDLYFSNVSEISTAHNDKEIIAAAIMAPERSKYMPDVTTLDEAGYPGVHSWSARGLAVKKGVSKEQVDKLVAAFEKGMTNPEHIKKMDEMGLAVKFMKGDEYLNFLKKEEEAVKDLFDLLEWKK